MLIFAISVAAVIATFLGGLFALRFKDKLHLIIGFSAGAVLGVAFFDLLPEALELSEGVYDPHTIFVCMALGFVGYMILDRLILIQGNHASHDHCENSNHTHQLHTRGTFGALTLALHSMLDGLAIGFAFQVSSAVGIVVAAAVLAHDFSDGLNTVNIILRNGGQRLQALRWLIVDSLAPVLGVIISLFFTISDASLGLLLAVFGGFFIFIGASDLLPESHHSHSMGWTTLMTVLGIGLLYVVISIAHV